jgi:hypothetical protein
LFVANFLAINLAGALVFGLTGFAPADHLRDATRVARRFGVSVAALILTAGILAYSLAAINTKNRLEKTVRERLQTQMSGVPGARLDTSDPHNPTIEWKKGVLHVTAVVLTPQAIDPEQVHFAQNVLSNRVGKEVVLTIRSIVSIDAQASGFVKTPTAPAKEREAKEEPKRLALLDCRRIAEQILTDQVQSLEGGGQLVGLPMVVVVADTLVVKAKYQAPTGFTEGQVLAIERMIAGETRWDVRLTLERVGGSSAGAADQGEKQAPPAQVPGAQDGIHLEQKPGQPPAGGAPKGGGGG